MPDFTAKTEYEVTFLRGGLAGNITFTRWATCSEVAAEEAREGFQWQFGYWPRCPILIKEVSKEAVGREEHEPCQRGTLGCSVDHPSRSDRDDKCEPW